ncbi:MAG: ABC transporter ATP-binding protein [Cellulosilyticaceae bacterium]
MLKISRFSKSYKGGQKAVDNLNIEVEAGDIYGFIGHNGAGKTTTLKACTGILDFEEGEIEVDGISIKSDPISCKKVIAFIPDNPDLYGYLTGIQYLGFICDIYEVSREDRQARIEKYAGEFEILERLGDLISAYSHGMRQKLAIVGALVHEPKLLILDEPFVGLDPKAAHTLKQLMHEHCERGHAIFFSTHVLDVAEKICNKIAIIKGGKLVTSGTTEEVKGTESLENVFLELVAHE